MTSAIRTLERLLREADAFLILRQSQEREAFDELEAEGGVERHREACRNMDLANGRREGIATALEATRKKIDKV